MLSVNLKDNARFLSDSIMHFELFLTHLLNYVNYTENVVSVCIKMQLFSAA